MSVPIAGAVSTKSAAKFTCSKLLLPAKPRLRPSPRQFDLVVPALVGDPTWVQVPSACTWLWKWTHLLTAASTSGAVVADSAPMALAQVAGRRSPFRPVVCLRVAHDPRGATPTRPHSSTDAAATDLPGDSADARPQMDSRAPPCARYSNSCRRQCRRASRSGRASEPTGP